MSENDLSNTPTPELSGEEAEAFHKQFHENLKKKLDPEMLKELTDAAKKFIGNAQMNSVLSRTDIPFSDRMRLGFLQDLGDLCTKYSLQIYTTNRQLKLLFGNGCPIEFSGSINAIAVKEKSNDIVAAAVVTNMKKSS